MRTLRSLTTLLACTFIVPSTLLLSSCSTSSTAATTTSSTNTNQYAAVYEALTWGTGVTVSFPSSCTMTIKSTGVPPQESAYYLAPASGSYTTVVAYTPVSNLALVVTPYTPSSISASSGTFNICPSAQSSTTATSLGPIGYIRTGEFMYNAFEATSTPALSDNVSYTFMVNGTSYTASFIDACNSHPTPLNTGYTWHYHGVPTCETTAIDGTSGPSHIIGIALDGFPIYGGRDINGVTINVSQLDACNGITSPTPEFPNGAYHYVLPIGVTTRYSSLNCYTGNPNSSSIANTDKIMCRKPLSKVQDGI